GSARERERDDEMRAHMALLFDELVARGKTVEDARREARLAFGNPRVKLEEVDEMNRLPLVETLWRDVKYAVRVLRRTPAFSLTAIATLALVIGANTAVFSLADALLLRPLPLPHPEQLGVLQVEGKTTKGSGQWESHDGTTWEVVRDGVTAVDVAVV